MHIPRGFGGDQINGLLRHVQNLIQRPQTEVEPARPQQGARGVGSGGQRDQGDGGGGAGSGQETPVDPAELAARAAQAGKVFPRGTFLDITV